MLKIAVFPHYSRSLCLRIVKTVNTKTANSEGRLYLKIKGLQYLLLSSLPQKKNFFSDIPVKISYTDRLSHFHQYLRPIDFCTFVPNRTGFPRYSRELRS